MRVERSEIEETGDYDLEGLFVRLGHAIDSIGAKRVVLDTIEALFAGFDNAGVLRAELRRLFRWLKDKGVTAVITGERGEGTLTRHGLEEYVSDCVILLDHRVERPGLDAAAAHRQVPRHHARHERVSVPDRRAAASRVLPITSLGLEHEASDERMSSGYRRLDDDAGRRGLLSRQQRAGVRHGRHRQDAARGALRDARLPARRALPLLRVRGIAGPDRAQHALDRHRPRARGSTRGCCSSTPAGRRSYGLEMHLATMHKLVREFAPRVVVI